MKAIKITLIIQAVAMYLMHLPLIILAVMLLMPNNHQLIDQFAGPFIITSFILMFAALPICVLNAVFALISIFKGNENPAKVTLIVKGALIPWFLCNFYFCMCIVAGLLNPFLLLAAPITIVIQVCVTYIFMVVTSLPDLAYYIRSLIRRETKFSAAQVVGIVLMFFFCLDFVGAIIFYNSADKR